MIIGRSDPFRNHMPQIDLGPIDPENSVSRVHAEIYADTAGWFIEDKGSLNGTRINGMRLAPNEPRRLNAMDECEFGRIAFRFADGKLKQIKTHQR